MQFRHLCCGLIWNARYGGYNQDIEQPELWKDARWWMSPMRLVVAWAMTAGFGAAQLWANVDVPVNYIQYKLSGLWPSNVERRMDH